ncbi:MAG: dTDP-glucose 4,6-dehydratase [Planctomycetes bacterium]|nr:dTDP-glucose 4,6-dehydratase [Planctomycetota bacterium]
MRLLVTGGAGFIGSNFVLHVLRERPAWRVWNLDKLTYAGNLENLASARGDPRHQFIKGDICDAAVVERTIADQGIEAVINFAAETHVDRSIADSEVFIRSNVLGAHVLLDVGRRRGVKRHVQVGTDEVYGSLGETGCFTEETPLAPNSPYAAAKAAADLLCRAFARTHGYGAIVTRCSNNYGPFQFPEKMLPLMIANAMHDRQLPVYGDGMNVRDWLHVEDHCAALLLALERGRPGEVYNVGGKNEWRNLDVVKLVLRRLGKPESLIRFVADRPGHDRRYAIDPSKIMAELGWAPRVAFEEGLSRTIAWYRENAAWVANVTSGAYQDYYRAMYQVDEQGRVRR